MPLSLEEIKQQAYLQYVNKTTSKNFQNNVTIEDGKIYKLISTMIDSISASLTGGGGGGEANTASNLGTTADGSGIFAQKVGVDLEFKRIDAGFGIGITESASAVSISASSGSGGEVNTASNIGAIGEGLFAQKVGVDLEFKKIIAGDNIALTPSASGVSISASVTGGGETNTASNLGTTADGSGIFAQKVGVDLEFKRLFAGDKIGITESASALSISASVTGQANTASNMGADEDSLAGIFSQKVGDDLQFKLLQQGNNIELTASSSAIEIAVTGLTGQANTASNIGVVGEGLFAQKVGDDLQFKNIIAGDNIALTPSASGVSISASVTGGGGEVNTASNTGTGEGTIFKEKSGVDLIFKSLKAGSNVTITNDINEIIISAVSIASIVYMNLHHSVYTTYQTAYLLSPQFSQYIVLT